MASASRRKRGLCCLNVVGLVAAKADRRRQVLAVLCFVFFKGPVGFGLFCFTVELTQICKIFTRENCKRNPVCFEFFLAQSCIFFIDDGGDSLRGQSRQCEGYNNAELHAQFFDFKKC